MTEPPNSPEILASEPERDAAEARLQRATGAGTLTLEEFSERMEALLRARTRGELEKVVSDLPEPSFVSSPVPAVSRRPTRRWLVAVLGGEETRGRWRPARRTSAIAVMGGVEVDLRNAEVVDNELDLDAIAVMGGIEVIVPEGVDVEMRGFAFMGGRELNVRQDNPPGAPLVRVNAYALMGGVEVKTGRGRAQGATLAGHQPMHGTVHPPAIPGSGAVERPQRRGWFGRALAVVAIAAVTAPIWTPGPGAVAVFGNRVERVSAEEAAEGATVTTTAMFGSVQVIVPEGVSADSDVLALFGSADCPACEEQGAGADEVNVRGVALFGSVEIVNQGSPELEQD